MRMKTDAEIERAFRAAVNMSAAELAVWLDTEESRAVGWRREGDAESIGHASGRAILALLRKRAKRYTPDERAHMRKVVGFIHRHRAQRPHGDISRTRWRYSLMNWGHDPVKSDPI